MENIERITSNLVQKYNTNSPFELCDYLGVNVIYQELPDCVRGFFIKILKSFVVVINNTVDEDEAKVVCAHELGHIILHSETNSISLNSRTYLCTSKYEREADLFAVNLLLQGEIFPTDDNLSAEEISRITHIPLKLIMLKYFPE
ncbi:ImmA/IrrE family metallo-endopeptidase [Candidatus Pseudoruminococcus sp.]|uniref:ImmA/IrrE family metallo-endopeptidase n=1 Tax=Candidatus Pseudoruminococcus sp. TaxID=3101048 RepID=UPI00399BE98F|nr:ImmA/IrrE family metallo-endopeptidase [Ruminococcus sp.]